MSNSIELLRKIIDNDDNVKSALAAMPGNRGGAFANSLINLVRNSKALQKCDGGSIMSAAMVASSMNLAIDPALGLAAIVPYGNKAQFQLMYKGMTQLCIRSGQYERIHTTEVYKDELKYYNAITGEIFFTDIENSPMRNEAKLGDVAGYYATFKLLKGFICSGFMTHEQVMTHAKKFSKAYQYDLRDKKQTSVWSTDPVAMGKKTVLKAILTKYGIMSIEMQDALIADHVDTTYEGAKNINEDKIAAEAGGTVIDVEPESTETNEVEDPDAWMKDQQ